MNIFLWLLYAIYFASVSIFLAKCISLYEIFGEMLHVLIKNLEHRLKTS